VGTMQELFLFGQVDDSRHTQLLSILAGLTAAKPRPILERHVLFKPIRASGPDVRALSSQTIATKPTAPATSGAKESFYISLVKTLQPMDFGKTSSNSEGWVQRFYDTPDPVQRSAGLRTVRDVGVQGDNPMEAMRGAGYL
jgi:mediator of RNA polymerase II transcription subunit 18, fungi type